MNNNELENVWYYFLDLEKELSDSSRYIEPYGQDNVYSFEFRKIIILACTECETVFKSICESIDNTKKRGSISYYKGIILGKYPKIVDAEVTIRRWHKTIKPFKDWDTGNLKWWTAHQNVKHDRGSNFYEATYENAVFSLSALYVLIFYLYVINDKEIPFERADEYISSEYTPPLISCMPNKKLPDFH